VARLAGAADRAGCACLLALPAALLRAHWPGGAELARWRLRCFQRASCWAPAHGLSHPLVQQMPPRARPSERCLKAGLVTETIRGRLALLAAGSWYSGGLAAGSNSYRLVIRLGGGVVIRPPHGLFALRAAAPLPWIQPAGLRPAASPWGILFCMFTAAEVLLPESGLPPPCCWLEWWVAVTSSIPPRLNPDPPAGFKAGRSAFCSPAGRRCSPWAELKPRLGFGGVALQCWP